MDDRPAAGDSGKCQRGKMSPRLRLSHRLKGYSAQEAPENGDWYEKWQKPAAGEEQKAERRTLIANNKAWDSVLRRCGGRGSPSRS